jgi:hypothetical protein
VLSLEQELIIKDQISEDNASEFVRALLSKYADTTEKTIELLTYIPQLATKRLEESQNRIGQYSRSTELLIHDRYFHPGKYTKIDSHGRFWMLLEVCKAHFVDGNIEYMDISEQALFDEFVIALKKKNGFDYTSAEDWFGIYIRDGCADWLESVIRQKIDSNFVKPKNTYNDWLQGE